MEWLHADLASIVEVKGKAAQGGWVKRRSFAGRTMCTVWRQVSSVRLRNRYSMLPGIFSYYFIIKLLVRLMKSYRTG